jgi:hypothetical protein
LVSNIEIKQDANAGTYRLIQNEKLAGYCNFHIFLIMICSLMCKLWTKYSKGVRIQSKAENI